MMKKVLSITAFAILFLCGYSAIAQITLEPRLLISGNSSANGMKQFTMSNDGAADADPWGDSVALNAPIVEMPVVRAIDSLACTPLVNGTSAPALTGKAALIFRGSCEFGAKALAAQNAGASMVIIVNNVPGAAPAGMGSGAVGASVTVPVVMVSYEDGMEMNMAIRNSQTVLATLTRFGSGKVNDVGFVPNGVAEGHASLMPRVMLDATNGNPKLYQIVNGAVVGNFGTANQTNVKLKQTVSWKPASSSTATVVYRDSTVLANFNQVDTLDGITSNRAYDMHPTTTGRYLVDYELSMTNTDQLVGDNKISTFIDISDSTFSKGKWNASLNRPVGTQGWRFGSSTISDITWGPLYYIGMNGYAAQQTQVAVSQSGLTSLDGAGTIEVYISEWEDANADGLMQGTELDLVGFASKMLGANDSSFKFFTVNYLPVNPALQNVSLTAGRNYWVTASMSNDFFLTADGNHSYFMRSFTQALRTPTVRELYAPIFPGLVNGLVGDTVTSFPFSGSDSIQSVGYSGQIGLVPALSLQLMRNTIGIKDANTVRPALSIYPNPAQTQMQVQVKLDKRANRVIYSVANALGQKVTSIDRGSLQNDVFTLDVSQYAAGNYTIVVNADGAASIQKFTVVK